MMTQCPSHPGAESVGTCARCGRFYCAPERIELDDKPYCGDCGVREDVDWLGQHYRKLEGRRSGLAWVVLGLGLPLGVLGVATQFNEKADWRDHTVGAALIVFGLSSVALFLGKFRPSLLIGTLVGGALLTWGVQDWWGLLFAVPVFGLGVSTWTDVRTKLFFRVPVPRKALQQHYKREGSNPLAIQASRLALLGLFLPGVGLISLVLGVMALTRIDSKAVPPVGNLSAALSAVIFSLVTTAFWGLSFMSARW